MQKPEVVTSIVLSAHALARIAAHDTGNEAPSAQWRTLNTLEGQSGMRLGALARATRTTQPGMTRMIGTLEEAGFVRRSPDPADSRATLVSATDDGLEALRQWRTQIRDALAPRFAHLSAADWQAMQRVAEILAEHTQDTTTRTGADA